MRRIFTSTIFLAVVVAASFSSTAQQCTTGVSYTPGATFDFNGGMQGFTSTDFAASANKMVSTDITFGTTKVLTTATFTQPASQNTISWGFDLAGSANVVSYVVEAIYSGGTVPVCSGGAIGGNNLTFSGPAPAQVLGQSFELRFTFTLSGNSSQNITIDNFSTSALIAQSPLPVRFSSLDARMANNSVSLKWNVGTEENLNGYQIEKSSDGHSYSSIGFVNATGVGSYTFTDTKPFSITYYRIKSVDVNGIYGYSTVAMVKGGKAVIVIKAFPTPFIKNVSIQHPSAVTRSTIVISSEDGRVVKTIVPAIGAQQTDVDLSSARSGLYIVRYNDGNGTSETLKILKQ